MILCVASESDVASKSISERVISLYGFERLSEQFRGHPTYGKALCGREVRLVTVAGELVDEQKVADSFKPELIVFLSRHASRDARRVLTVHVPGNLGSADFGGLPRRVSVASANAMRNVLCEMVVQRDALDLKEFEVCYEGTHHGPSLDFPAMFVEVGSGPSEWCDSRAAEVVARAFAGVLKPGSASTVALGVGGSHYNRRFTRLAVECGVAFGHIVPSYLFEVLDAEMLRQCVERTLEKAQVVILDWKGIDGKDREELLAKVGEVPLEVRRVSDFRAVL